MRQNVTVIFMFLFIFLLGMWGHYVLDPAMFWLQFANKGYDVLTLFVLEGDWTQEVESLPWQLQITRYLAPLALVTGILIVATRDAWVTIHNSSLRLRQGHIVVAGLGDKAWQFIQSCRDKGLVIAVVELNPDNPYIVRARSQNFNVIVGDILEAEKMHQVNLENAGHLVTFTGDDGTNVELAIKARDYVKEKNSAQRLRIHLHLDDTLVSERLESYDKFFMDSGAVEISFFSVYYSTARLLFSDYPPDLFSDVFGLRNVHIAIYTVDSGHDMGRHVVLEATRFCKFAFLEGQRPRLRFTVFTDEADRWRQEWLENYPMLQEREVCFDINFVQRESRSLNQVYNIPEELLQAITFHVVCGESDGWNLQLGIALRKALLKRRAANAPVLVRMQQSSGLSQLLESEQGKPEIPDGLFPFGMLDRVLSEENILGDRIDRLARAFNDEYRTKWGGGSEWHLATEKHRKSSRLEADHLDAKLRAIRCEMVRHPEPEFRFLGDEAEVLAEMEHNRWRVNRIYDDNRSGDFFKPWHLLSEEQVTQNVELIEAIPDILAAQGWGIQRDFKIGVTGHRLNKMDIHNERLRRSISSTLQQIVDRNPGACMTVISPLAEGSDRLVAKIAMEEFGMGLEVPLPLPYELYMEDFEQEESLDEFKELVGKADMYYELPTRFGTQEQLSQNAEDDLARNHQYALVGAFICERCDELVAIYDGGPAAGIGGTADVVQWRRKGEVPDEYRYRSRFFQRPLLRDPIVLSPDP